jgi:predicted DNA-binding ribbon-helix-helix protein
MSTTITKPAVINARVEQRHADRLKQIAERNASTVSRVVGRIIAEQLDSEADVSDRT